MENKPAPTVKSAYPIEFESFWNECPRRIAKKMAYKSWQKAIREGADPDLIISAMIIYRKWLNDGNGWKPEAAHPATWLNQGRWEDELEEKKEDIRSIIFKIAPEWVSKLRSVNIPDAMIKRWFDEAEFQNSGNIIVFKSEFIRDYVNRNYESNLNRAFSFSPQLLTRERAA